MILIDVYVPVCNRVYDFYLDSQKSVEQLITEISGLIAEQEDADLDGEATDFWLCEMSKGVVLHGKYSLAEQGIKEGAGLLLV